MFRARRNPLAGLMLLAILTPLLAAGPGMPCAGSDVEHHEAVGHVMDHDHAAMQSGMQSGMQSAMQSGAQPSTHTTTVAPAPDSSEEIPAAPACAMGMMCSGTVVTPVSAMLSAVPAVHLAQFSTSLWTPHLSDLSIPDRPPRA